MKLHRALKKAKRKFKSYQGVKGIALGRKEIGGHAFGTQCIRITVGRKLLEAAIPRDQLIPRLYKGCATDVIERRESFEFNQVKPAGDCSHPDVTCGTNQGHYWSKTLQKWVLNSNLHVIVGLGNDDPIGDNTLVPCTSHGGQNPENAVATVVDFEPLKPEGEEPPCSNIFCSLRRLICQIFFFNCQRDRNVNQMDHAIAELHNQENVEFDYPTAGRPVRLGRPKVGDIALRDSWQGGPLPDGHDWRAEVLEIDGEYRINGGDFGFFWISAFQLGQKIGTNFGAIGGQSGSAVRSEDGQELWGGLHAGSTEVAIIYYADVTFDRFNLSIEP